MPVGIPEVVSQYFKFICLTIIIDCKHSFSLQAPHDPDIWLYYSKHYSMQTWFYYLVKKKGVDTNDILDYYVEDRGMSPQQYWFELFGGENLRSWFADWVAHIAADMDYLTREEFKVAKDRYLLFISRDRECVPNPKECEPHSYVWEGADAGTDGMTRPPTSPLDLTTRGWSYNVWRINSTTANTYR